LVSTQCKAGQQGNPHAGEVMEGITRMSNIDQSNIDLLDATTLPPLDSWNPEAMMPRRIERGRRTILAYTALTEFEPDASDTQSAAGDLIADVLHALRAIGADPEAALKMAEAHFTEEEDERTHGGGGL
jgi:hypothetical protein